MKTISYNLSHWSNTLLLRFLTLSLLAILVLSISSCDDDEGPAAAELTVTSISPDTGGEGTQVNITGTGFSTVASQNTVTLNDKGCVVVVATETLLKITIPADAGTGNIKVTVNGQTAETPTFTFIPADQPLTVTSISPTSGPRNTAVVITGTGFSATPAENTVTLNGITCTVTNASTTQLSITIPAGAGSGNIIVGVNGSTVESEEFEFIYTTEVSTLAGSSSGYAEGNGTSAQFSQPYQIAVDGNGNVYVADAGNHRIRKITAAGEVSTLAGGTQGTNDGTGADAQFNYPYGVTMGSDGNIYVADTHNHRVRKVTPEGVVTTVAGSTGGYADGNGASAQFYYLTGITSDADGNLYIADKDNFKIRKIAPNGDVTTLAGSSSGYVDATGTDAKFAGPFNVAVDGSGNVYVSDANNHKIRKVTPAGEVTTIAGGDQGDAVGTGSEARFYYPYTVAIDADENLYITDTFNQKVKKINTEGVVSTYAGSTNGYADGEASIAQFNYPTGVTVSPSGIVYVADKDNHKIRVITVD